MNNVLDNRTLSAFLWFILILSFLLGGIGPFGQDEKFPVFERIGLWVSYLLVALPLLWIVYLQINKAILSLCNARFHTSIILTATLVAVPILFVVEVIGYTQGRPFPQTMTEMAKGTAEVGIAGMLLLFLWTLFFEMTSKNTASKNVSKENSRIIPSKLRRNLGIDFGDTIHAIRAEGNYTRVYGETHSCLINLTFSDTARYLSHFDGSQVHRSWWVHRPSVMSVSKVETGVTLLLADGTQAPIARRRKTGLRKLGWPL